MKTSSEIMTGTTAYNGAYAERYVGTIRSSYTQLKNERVASVLGDVLPGPTPRVIDLGGNINGTITFGMRAKLEEARPGVKYGVIDVHPAYFNTNLMQETDGSVTVYPQENVSGIVGDARKMPIADSSVEGIILSDVLEHIERPQEVIAEVSRVLTPDGVFAFVSPAMYKLDAVKGQNFDVQEAVDERIDTTGHINFFDHPANEELMAEANLDIKDLQGIDYVGGIQYLLWLNEEYILRNEQNPGTPKEARFKRIRSLIRQISSEERNVIDEALNNDGDKFFQRYVGQSGVHPLSLVHEVLKVHPDYEVEGSSIRTVHDTLRAEIDEAKVDFDGDHLRGFLTNYFKANNHQYLANSVFILAQPKVATP